MTAKLSTQETLPKKVREQQAGCNSDPESTVHLTTTGRVDGKATNRNLRCLERHHTPYRRHSQDVLTIISHYQSKNEHLNKIWSSKFPTIHKLTAISARLFTNSANSSRVFIVFIRPAILVLGSAWKAPLWCNDHCTICSIGRHKQIFFHMHGWISLIRSRNFHLLAMLLTQSPSGWPTSCNEKISKRTRRGRRFVVCFTRLTRLLSLACTYLQSHVFREWPEFHCIQGISFALCYTGVLKRFFNCSVISPSQMFAGWKDLLIALKLWVRVQRLKDLSAMAGETPMCLDERIISGCGFLSHPHLRSHDGCLIENMLHPYAISFWPKGVLKGLFEGVFSG